MVLLAGAVLSGLDAAQLEAFVRDGFVRVPGAFGADVGERCRDELWAAAGVDRDDPATWTTPFVRIDGLRTRPFVAAANTAVLRRAYDQLVGPGRWVPPSGLGTFPLRFPVGRGDAEAAQDGGWHLEAGWAGDDGEWRVDLRSHHRALLMLFLFSEIGTDDAPTRIRVGSHLAVPALLEPYGDAGLDWRELCRRAVPATADRPVALATGSLGDVYLCHPFLVHAAQVHRGSVPRFLAQPPLSPSGPVDLEERDPTPVARAILAGLNR